MIPAYVLSLKQGDKLWQMFSKLKNGPKLCDELNQRIIDQQNSD